MSEYSRLHSMFIAGLLETTGAVGTFFDSVQAAVAVSRVSGVESVDNQLEVRKPGSALCVSSAP